jgi:uncharacterized cupredoxin-like copper-binding protein
MSSGLTFIAITLLALSILTITLTVLRRNKITLMSGMMIAMASGMMMGLASGIIAGILFKGDLFIATIIGASVGIVVGSLSGISVGVIGFLDGILSGLMGGMMGAMLGEMIDPSYHEITTRMTFIICLAIMIVLISIVNKDNGGEDKWYGKITNNPIVMTTTLGLVLLLSIFHGTIWEERKSNLNTHQGHSETNKMNEQTGKIITIGTSELNYLPNAITIKKGEKVTVILENMDEIEHDLELETDNVQIFSTNQQHNHNDNNLVHIHAQPKSKSEIVFAVLEKGNFVFKCTIPGHDEAGMHGKIKVM